MEDTVRKPSVKTYSRKKKHRDTENDAVFAKTIFESLKQNIFSPEDDVPTNKKGGKRRQRTASSTMQGSLKKLKQSRSKKATLKVQTQPRMSADISLQAQDVSLEDVLFRDDIQPVKRGRKTSTRRIQAKKAIPRTAGARKRERVKKDSLKDQDTNILSGRSHTHEIGNAMATGSNLQEKSSSSDQNGLPPRIAIKSVDKVSDWLAKTDKGSPQHDESTKEIWRQEQHFTGDEMRSKLFPEEFYQNLNNVLQKPVVPPVKTNQLSKDNFLSQIALKGMDQHQLDKYMGYSDVEDDVTYTETQTCTQSCAQTGTQSTTQTGTQSTSQTGSLSLTQSGFQTGTQTESETRTGTYGTTTTIYTDTKMQSQSQRRSKSQLASEGPGTRQWAEEFTTAHTDQNYKRNSITTTDTDIPADGFQSGKKSGKSGAYMDTDVKDLAETWTSEEEQSVLYKVPDTKAQKYLCSTMRRSMCANKSDFPSELSSVADSVKKQQEEEKTPRRSREDFKMPGSPVKYAAFKGVRKGVLHPKNSTKLFTSGFVEIVDVIPQMSTIVIEPDSKLQEDEQVGSMEDQAQLQKQQNIKTSTPNKVDSKGQAFQFEIDISSVNMDSDEDELLHFQESREVNSEECIHLSDIVITDPQPLQGWSSLNNLSATTTSYYAADDGVADNNHIELHPSTKNKNIGLESNDTLKPVSRKRKKSLKGKPVLSSGKITNGNSKVQVTEEKTRKCVNIGSSRPGLQNKGIRKRKDSAGSKVPKQIVSSTDITSGKLSGKLPVSCDMAKNVEQPIVEKQRSNGVNDDCRRNNKSVNKTKLLTNLFSSKDKIDPKLDPYDIDESAKNVPSPHSQKLARKQLVMPMKLGFKGKDRKKREHFKRKRIPSDLGFDPRGTLRFTSTIHSSMDGKDYTSSFPAKEMQIGARNVRERGSEARWGLNIPICSLHQDFTCPKGIACVTKYKNYDPRSYQEILQSVPIDVLW